MLVIEEMEVVPECIQVRIWDARYFGSFKFKRMVSNSGFWIVRRFIL